MDRATNREELLRLIASQLADEDMLRMLDASAFSRRVDLTIYIDRGRVAKPPQLLVS